jgi:phosphohistidine swiveling domain-containing protein
MFYRNKILFLNEMGKVESVGGRIFREIILTEKIKKLWQVWLKYLNQLLSFCRKIDKDYLKSLSDLELKKEWKKFNQLIYHFWEPGVIPELGAYGSEPILKQALDKEDINEIEKREFFSVLSAPTKFSFYQEEELDLLKLIEKYKSPSFKSLLKKHQQKYFWLENSYFRTRVLKEDFFLKRIRQKIRVNIKLRKAKKEMYQHLKSLAKNKNRVLAELANKKPIKKLSDGLTLCIWWQDQRKKYIFQYLHCLDVFIEEFARRSEISPRIFDFAWPKEVSVNPTKKLVNLLKGRRENPFVVHFLKRGARCYYKKRARKIFNIFWFAKEKMKKDELEGLVVYAGNKAISGRVFVIRTASDLKKFPKGRILVTSMTAPEYITAIRKARAIVTDTGGITCHAAIVSRELKVPCIVGTKIATRVLKDGDRVEVDATRGTVRKI